MLFRLFSICLRYGILLPIGLIIIVINYRLYNHISVTENEDGKIVESVVAQLNYIDARIAEGAAEEMQAFYPEGFLFAHYTRALAWTDVLKTVKKTSPLYKKGVASIRQSIDTLDSPFGKNIFGAGMQPDLGAFFNGWKSVVIGNFIKNHPEQADAALWKNYETTCDALFLAYENRLNDSLNTIFLDSYKGQIWACDNIVAMAGLKIYNDLKPNTAHEKTLKKWISRLKNNHTASLIPFRTNEMGIETASARGCSQSLILTFLPLYWIKLLKKNMKIINIYK